MTNAFAKTKLCASVLALSVASTAVWADTHATGVTNNPSTDMAGMKGDLIRTRDITGGNIYSMSVADDEGWDSPTRYEGVGDDWNKIGGFLDIADKHVMIPVDNVRLVSVDDRSYSYVTRMTEEELEALPEVDEGFWD